MSQLILVDRLRISRAAQFGLHIDNLQVGGGAIVCIVGPNGSGKTTLVECLTGLLTPTIGTIAIDAVPVDRNLRATKRILGFVPDDENWFIKELCAREYFSLLEGVYHRAGVTSDMKIRLVKLARQLHFTAFEQPLHELSHGNKKKVQLIAGLMHRPRVIILDEVRNGLDPLAIIAAEQLIRQEARRGAAVVVTTHDLWWAQRIAHEIIVLLDGKIAMHEKTSRILKQYGSLEKCFLKIAMPA